MRSRTLSWATKDAGPSIYVDTNDCFTHCTILRPGVSVFDGRCLREFESIDAYMLNRYVAEALKNNKTCKSLDLRGCNVNTAVSPRVV